MTLLRRLLEPGWVVVLLARPLVVPRPPLPLSTQGAAGSAWLPGTGNPQYSKTLACTKKKLDNIGSHYCSLWIAFKMALASLNCCIVGMRPCAFQYSLNSVARYLQWQIPLASTSSGHIAGFQVPHCEQKLCMLV